MRPFGATLSLSLSLTLASTANGFLTPVLPKNVVTADIIVTSGRRGIANVQVVKLKPSLRRQDLCLRAKLWDRLGIEEDDEPRWYLLNCVAGLEMDLLAQCRMRCEGMKDVVRFVVPTEKKTRSHGANRMVTETKVKYLGYVFAKLRLCEETYEAIQNLDLCRSWMGTVNSNPRGNRKLPPAPIVLNEVEVENFGLENVSEVDEIPEIVQDDGVILDSSEVDRLEEVMDKQEKETMKVYQGLRVEDMVKVTAENKFHGEDGVIKRLKDGLIKVRFFTYGSTYDEWLQPGDVRPMSEVEIMRGLGGPSRPITQRDFDERDGKYKYREDYQSRRNMVGGVGVDGSRNRRQDRVADRFRRGESAYDQQRNDDNWNRYSENQREKDRNQGREFADGDWGMRGSQERYGSNRDGRWAQSDDDSRWGRSQNQQQREPRRDMRNRKKNARVNDLVGRTIDGGADWNKFITPVDNSPKQDRGRFFDSSMDDISPKERPRKPAALDRRQETDLNIKKGPPSDDAFFSSLMAEMANMDSNSDDFYAAIANEDAPFLDTGKGKKKSFPKNKDHAADEFFLSLGAELEDSLMERPPAVRQRDRQSKQAADDFFSSLGAELDDSLSEELPSAKQRGRQNIKVPKKSSSRSEIDENDDFFANLEHELVDNLGSSESDEFFAKLEAELSTELDSPISRGRSKGKSKKSEDRFSNLDDDKFFDDLVLEDDVVDMAPQSSNKRKQSEINFDNSKIDDWFNDLVLGNEISKPPTSQRSKEKTRNKQSEDRYSDQGGDDFFDDLVLEDEVPKPKPRKNKGKPAVDAFAGDVDGFFDDLVLADDVVEPAPKKTRTRKEPAASAATASLSAVPATSQGTDLQKLTVPVLKDMLRERGLKVSGNKADLIERLSQ